MAEKIVEGLFGLQPWQIQEQRRQQQYADAMNYAQLDPFQWATAGMYMAGAQLGDIGAGMLGLERPEVTQAKLWQSIMYDGGLDMSPEGLRAKAERFRQAGDLNTAFRLYQYAQQQEAASQDIALKKAQEQAALLKGEEPDYKYATREERLLAARNKYPPGSDEWNYFDSLSKQALSENAVKGGGGEPESKYATREEKLLAARDRYPQGSAEWKYFNDLLLKELYGNAGRSTSGGTGKTTTGSVAKPKSLTREASLKWDLDHGYIDKQTYDQAMLGTPGAKAEVSLDKEIRSFRVMDDKFKEIEKAMSDALGVPPEKLEEALTSGAKKSASTLESAVGFFEGQDFVPAFSQNKKNILNHIERLKHLGETTGLVALRAAGVAPGTITEKEWVKFRADLANLDTTLSGKELVKQFYRIFQKIQESRIRANEDILAIKRRLQNNNNTKPSKNAKPSGEWKVVR